MNFIDKKMRVLVAGWFSWEHMGATAGDLIAKDIVCEWLKEAEVKYDVAVHARFSSSDEIDWEKADANIYTDIIFVCGPFGNGYPVTDMLKYFSNARLTGVDLSLLDSLENWNPFTLLYERDSSRASNPDITFMAPPPRVPVVGVILAHKQKEYGSKARHDDAEKAIDFFSNSREMSIVPIDTAITNNIGKLRTAGEIEALIAKMDIIITTRLHGTVLALKNGVPVIPIDPVAGGAKISLQVKTIGWPVLLNADKMNPEKLADAFDYCLSAKAKILAERCTNEAIRKLEIMKEKFIGEIKKLSGKEHFLHDRQELR